MKLITKTIRVTFFASDSPKSNVDVKMYEFENWVEKFKFVYVFDDCIFYGAGGFSNWQSKQLIKQVKMLQILQSGMQQNCGQDGPIDDGGSDEYKFLVNNIKRALDLQ
jgi:hypothetical protein